MAVFTATSAPLRIDIDSIASPGPEGLWQMPGGTVLRIAATPGHYGCFEVIAVDVAAADMAPGTVIGTLRLGADRHKADALLLTDMRTGRTRHRMTTYAITFSPDYRSMSFDRYRQGWTVDLVRMLPYLFRPGYERRDSRPTGLDGAAKMPVLPSPVQL